MSIVVPVLAVVGLAVFALGVATLSAVVAHHPGRAALLMVLVAAAGAAAVALLGVVGAGVSSVESALAHTSVRRAATVAYDPARLVAGLGLGAALLGVATWLGWTGDGAHVDREKGTEDAPT